MKSKRSWPVPEARALAWCAVCTAVVGLLVLVWITAHRGSGVTLWRLALSLFLTGFGSAGMLPKKAQQAHG
ncbi:hypothetical protein [Streptomyces sp. NPDC047071]|uniref:hypothetical protein n=1 Tax=Streptomyces sp. NPDC047071 TaxID=3154808 RepID=UPI003452790B